MAESNLVKKREAWRVKVEPRLEEPTTKDTILVSVGAVVVALILGGIVIAIVGGNPFLTYIYIARASFGSVMEHRRGRTVHHGRVGCERYRVGARGTR